MKISIFVLTALLLSVTGISQTCTNPGQNPSTAFPVCGTSIFTQNTVPLCGGRALPSPSCKTSGLEDINPYWYKFTCFKAGKLGFIITPKDLGDDYDWELYDITGKNPDDIYTDGSLVVTCNWSGEKGLTGASSAGKKLMVCGGLGQDVYSTMADLKEGHNYLLLISHFTPSQSGYTLEFKGGTAVITDPAPPSLKAAEASCAGNKIRVTLNKKMKCSSIASNGSDFIVTPGAISVVNAVGVNCSGRFDTDALELTLSQPLPPGNYKLEIKTGTDANTILDYCDNGIPVSNSVPFEMLPKAPTPMDKMDPVTCAPSQLKLIFKKPILCNTIASNGSDFIVNGSYPVAVTGASGACSSGLTKEITIQLDHALEREGSFSLELRRGTDGNTLLDECGEETPAGSTLAFSVKDTVNADFTYNIQFGCKEDVVDYFHDGNDGVNNWEWNLDENLKATTQDPQARYKIFNNKNVELIVSNGFCKDTSTQTVVLDNYLKAGFTVFEDNCPLEPVVFTNTSVGKIASHSWNFADGNISSDPSPSNIYSRPSRTRSYNVRYTVTDIYGCTSTEEKTIKIYNSCYIDMPSAFTPNGDQINDILYPLNAVKAEKLDFRVYSRWGQLLYTTDNWKKGWDGRYRNNLQPSGIYIWTLKYTDRDTKKQIQRKGTVMLTR